MLEIFLLEKLIYICDLFLVGFYGNQHFKKSKFQCRMYLFYTDLRKKQGDLSQVFF